ncbi:MAG: hypothetical protein F9K38_06440 [Pseudorhodoplanes sp.]|nr:MAG: hypothetical protein F9K38_06440 [Pseudorhodoplanes sp.]
MDRFARYARSTISRDAGFVALAAVTLMVGFSFDPPLALQIGAQIALMFCLFLLCRICVLTTERLVRSEIWRGLEPGERPCGDHALARAPMNACSSFCCASPRAPPGSPACCSPARSPPR